MEESDLSVIPRRLATWTTRCESEVKEGATRKKEREKHREGRRGADERSLKGMGKDEGRRRDVP